MFSFSKFIFPEKDFAIKISDFIIGNRLIIVLISLVILLICVLIEVFIKVKKTEIDERGNLKSKPPLKSLKEEFLLSTYSIDNFEWKFKVGRFYDPTTNPDEDEFINDIEMSKTYCVKCKSKIKKGVSAGFYNRRERFAQCPNQECELNKKFISDYELENIEEQENLKFISRVRMDFDKYWGIYYDEYYRITGGKFDEYPPPIRKMHRR